MVKIWHLSGSSLNCFDTNIEDWYKKYILWEEPEFTIAQKQAMEFGKEYEDNLWKVLWDEWKGQEYLEEIIWGFKIIWYLDFKNEWEKKIIECKTKTGRRSENDIKTSRQFRFYNWWAKKNGYEFYIHQYNKTKKESKQEKVDFEDDFETSFIQKAKQIKRYLQYFNSDLDVF